ncbi:MAG: thioredoxin family protein [Planctomycetaceae bacterium]
MKRIVRNSAVCLTVAALVTFIELTAAAQSASSPEIGDKAPEWSDLAGVDEKPHSLNDLADRDIVVVCFTCNSCPYAVDYEDRLIALQKKFADDGNRAQLIAINSNVIPDDRLDQMQQRAKEKKFNFPYLWDESQDVARSYGAIYTPEFFVLNSRREIVYKGALDDSTDAARVSQRYVEDAVSAALAGKTPAVQKTGARGCTIRFERKRRKPAPEP